MKSARWFAVLCSLTLSPVASLQGQAPQVLEPKAERLQGPPLWISADAVADEKRIVNLDRLDSEFLRGMVDKQWSALGNSARLQQLETGRKPPIVSIPLAECRRTVLATNHRENESPRSTLTDLLTYSEAILRGTIRTIEPGFTFGVPSSLLVVEVTERIRGAAPPLTLYISYPVAHFRIGPLHFCNGTRGFEPSPGDEILLFDDSGPSDREALLYVPGMEQLIFQQKAGPLILPSNLKNTPTLGSVRTLDEFVAHVRSSADLKDWRSVP